MRTGLIDWLAVTSPSVPEEFLPWLEPSDNVNVSSEILARESVLQVIETLNLLGRGREGAFHLLAADAWATYGCEAAAEEMDVAGALEKILELLVSTGNRVR